MNGTTAVVSRRPRERLDPEGWVRLCRSPSTADHPRAEGVHLEPASFERWTWRRGL